MKVLWLVAAAAASVACGGCQQEAPAEFARFVGKDVGCAVVDGSVVQGAVKSASRDVVVIDHPRRGEVVVRTAALAYCWELRPSS